MTGQADHDNMSGGCGKLSQPSFHGSRDMDWDGFIQVALTIYLAKSQEDLEEIGQQIAKLQLPPGPCRDLLRDLYAHQKQSGLPSRKITGHCETGPIDHSLDALEAHVIDLLAVDGHAAQRFWMHLDCIRLVLQQLQRKDSPHAEPGTAHQSRLFEDLGQAG